MMTAWVTVWGILIVLFQASALVPTEKPTCVPGFQSDMLVYQVVRKHLRLGTRLGKVGFSDCTERRAFPFHSDDGHFTVQTDGMLKVKRPIDIHRHREFTIHSWDSEGHRISVPVRVVHHGHRHGKHHHDVERHYGEREHHNHLHRHTKVDSAENTESTTDQQVPILQFAKSVEGLRRRKRDWVIPPISVPENSRGPYPLKVAQIRSDRVGKIYYSITGSGASEAPVGIFAVHRDSGNLYVTQPLDREAKASYMFHAHAVADGAGIAEQPIEIIVNVIDQNDNKPVFAQSTFLGEVAESSPEGSEVIKIEATDLDEPNNDNSDIRYRIQSQDPTLPSDPLFAINPITGVIRVNAGGLDREKYPNYTLVVRAADMRGEGLNGEAKVILTVTHSNDNASAVTQPASTTDQQVPILQFAKSVEGLRRRKRAWIISPLGVAENSRGPYPLKVAQIRSIEHRVKRIYYSITGSGASEAPVGIFAVHRDSGNLYVTQPLDREAKASYMFHAHAVADGAGIAEQPIEIIVNVIDQNDNKPVFAQSTFLGEVAESSPEGSEVIKIEATDLDEPNNDNSDIRYRIQSQDPTLPSDPLFAINPITGVIRVNAGGLDREKYPNYTLVVRAADMRGEGLNGEAKVILTVTHSNDNASAVTQPASTTDQQVPILQFAKSVEGLRRRKRAWIIPPLGVAENSRGPYPLKVAQIRSIEHRVKRIYYSITGSGASEAPVGIFAVHRDSGNLYVTQPLDREAKASYMFHAHAVADGAGIAEEPMEIIVNVIDQNDNKPVFAQSTFLGEVAESSPEGSEVIKIEATDLDEPNNDNSDIRYRILSQDPTLPSDPLFAINPVTGVIRVNTGGLDREKYPNYTLVVRAADLRGEGLSGEAKVILTVTDSNDNAPAFTQPAYEASVEENKIDAHVITMSVTDGDEPLSAAWNAVFTIVAGDPGGLFTVKTTESNKHEGIISTAKALDFERSTQHTLLVAVVNEVPFAIPLLTATTTVVVTVLDVNEAPILNPM